MTGNDLGINEVPQGCEGGQEKLGRRSGAQQVFQNDVKKRSGPRIP